MSEPWSLLEFSDQQSATGLEHPVHLGNGSLLIILSDMVQSQGAGDRVKHCVRKWQMLGVADLEAHRYAMFARLRSCPADHLWTRVNAGDRAGRSHPLC